MAIHPCQNPAARQRAGVSRAECERAAYAVQPEGTKHRGAAAINLALAYSRNNPWPLRIYRLPLIGWLQERGYDLVVRLRHWLPGIEPYCQRFPEQCPDSASQATGRRG